MKYFLVQVCDKHTDDEFSLYESQQSAIKKFNEVINNDYCQYDWEVHKGMNTYPYHVLLYGSACGGEYRVVMVHVEVKA